MDKNATMTVVRTRIVLHEASNQFKIPERETLVKSIAEGLAIYNSAMIEPDMILGLPRREPEDILDGLG